jgi:hypothetical protein
MIYAVDKTSELNLSHLISSSHKCERKSVKLFCEWTIQEGKLIAKWQTN